MITIEEEVPGDVPGREALLDRCFGRTRRFKTSERLRRGRLPADGLAFSAHDNGVLVGTVRLWEIGAGNAGPALLLGPLAVEPGWQGKGIGACLMRHALAGAAARGHRAVVLVGDAPYYGRFGFRADLAQGLELPGPVDRHRFLAHEIEPGALHGATGRIVATGRRIVAAPRAARPLAA